MHMRFLPDEPIRSSLEDMLGFGDFVNLIHRSIYNTETPFVYGVLGDWGTGKTSILRLLENHFDKDLETGAAACVPIWFNPWEYENEANLIYPLLHAIKRSYDARITALDEARDFGKAFQDVVVTSALTLGNVGLRAATKVLSGEAIGLDDLREQLDFVREHPDALEAVLASWADTVGQVRDAFQTLLHTYAADLARQDNRVQADVVRFVILIDDLDRCLPETAIRILESIKNTFTVRRCIFVLALNARVVYQGIGLKYKNVGVDGREYLEKILNYTFYVPEPELDRVRIFAAERIQELVPDEERAKLRAHFDDFGSVLEECHFNNPRKIKRILNRYLLFLARHEHDLDKYFIPNIVRLIVMAEYFPSLFQVYVEDAERAQAVLHNIGGNFRMKEFEEQHGVSIAGIYPQLSIMRQLFKLQWQEDKTKPSPQQQVNDVYALTRLM